MACYVIAEIGVNHNGSMELAHRLIDAAVATGADAVKFQTFFAEDLVTPAASKAAYQVANTGEGGSQFTMLKSLELTATDFEEAARHCREAGIEFLSTPFSEAAADLLERIGVNAFKISSGDLTHLPMLAHIARKQRPIILSTGMGNLGEIESALNIVEQNGNPEVSIMHCVSHYPAAPRDCNLAAMDTIARAFGRRVGWSDHSEGSAISFAAVARGAQIIEKHITLNHNLPGPDHRASMEAEDFTRFVQGIREIEAALGNGIKRPTAAELQTAEFARRSITTARNLPKGHVIRSEDLLIMRPGTGLTPAMLELVIGVPLARDVAGFTPLTQADLHG